MRKHLSCMISNCRLLSMERTQANEKTDHSYTDFCIIVIYPLGNYLSASMRCSCLGKTQHFMQLTLRYEFLSITGFSSSMIVSPFLAFNCCRLSFCDLHFGCNRMGNKEWMGNKVKGSREKVGKGKWR